MMFLPASLHHQRRTLNFYFIPVYQMKAFTIPLNQSLITKCATAVSPLLLLSACWYVPLILQFINNLLALLTTVLAWAGWTIGFQSELLQMADYWRLEHAFEPQMPYSQWKDHASESWLDWIASCMEIM